MTQIQAFAADSPTEDRARRQRWSLLATAAGVLGYGATLVLDGRTVGADDVTISEKLFTDLDPLTYRLSMLVGYTVVVLLIVLGMLLPIFQLNQLIA